MARKNIFDVLFNKFDITKETERIKRLFESERLYEHGQRSVFSINEYVEHHCFSKWKNRSHCVDFNDFLETVGYEQAYLQSSTDLDSLFTFIEIVYNCLYMATTNGIIAYIDKEDLHLLELLKNNMDDCLAHFNHKGEYFKDKEQLLVIEDKPEATAVAEISEPDIAFTVLRYNHHLLKGDLSEKKRILVALGADLEGKRKHLHAIDSSLEDFIFTLLNNLNIRHNNVTPGTKQYKHVVAEMTDPVLEHWYDELYQMILLAYLELEHGNRKPQVKALKDAINGGK